MAARLFRRENLLRPLVSDEQRAAGPLFSARWGSALLVVLLSLFVPSEADAQATMRVGNLVWSDTNNDGIKQSHESGISGVTVQLWTTGANALRENGAGDDLKIGADVVTDINGNYVFTSVAPATNYYVRVPYSPSLYIRTSGTPVATDNDLDNDNNGSQPGGPATSVMSMVFALTANGEPGSAADGDDANGNMTIDFGFANPDLCYANTLLDNASFEWDGSANTTGNPVALLSYAGTGTTFGPGKNALQWIGNANGTSPLGAPIDRMQVLAISAGAKVSWVESAKARHGRRFMLFQGTNSCLDLRAAGGGEWSSKLQAGKSYEFALWADNASSASAGFLLDMGASASIIKIVSGPAQGTYQYFTATQPKWTGDLTSFAPTDFNGWNDTNNTAPNWRKFTINFSITPTATAAQIDTLSFVLAGGTGTGPIAVDDMYLCEVQATTDFGDNINFASASNKISQDLFMGTSATDGEFTNPITGDVDADDKTGGAPDDEDLIMPSDIYAGVPHTLTIPATRLAGVADARLGVWVDWNGDGDVSDPNEAVTTNKVVNTGNVLVTLNPPLGSQGNRYIRLRIQAGTGSVSFSGVSSAAGEVEDYVMNVQLCPVLNVTGPAGFPKGAIGVPYPAQSFAAAGAPGPFVWSMSPAIGGMSINPSTGVLSGIPTVSGTFNVTIRAADSLTTCDGALTITLEILACAQEQPFATGQSYNLSVEAGIVTAMWFRDGGSGPVPIAGANGLTYTVNQPGTYSWTGLDANGCQVLSCCAITYADKDYGDYLVSGLVSGVPTDLAQGSASVDSSLRIGTNQTDADDPALTVPNTTATADDSHNFDDEDTLMPSNVIQGGTSSISATILNDTGTNVYFSIWIDFNNNDSLTDAGEQIVTSQVISSSSAPQTLNFNFSVPVNASLTRDHWVRFRLNSSANVAPTGVGASGEVEDYLLKISPPVDDFGDNSKFGIASSAGSSQIFMGTTATDTEVAAQLNAAATADDNSGSDDEDAVTFGVLNAGQSASLTVKVTNTSTSSAYLTGWIDFNNDGALDSSERIVTDRPVPSGTIGNVQTVNFTVPGLARDTVGVRFRLTSLQNANPIGAAGNGEVEDHLVTVLCPLVFIDPPSLPDGAVNGPYSQTLIGSNATAPYTWVIKSGTLPAGLSLNSSTGVISGTPTTTVSSQSFTVEATDAVGCKGTLDYTINIRSLRIGNLVWIDTNPNGTKDNSEFGVPGLTMELWSTGVNDVAENGAGDDVKARPDTTTNFTGLYSFADVPPGNYYVRIPNPPPFFPAVTAPVVNLDNGIDSDNNGIQSASGQPVTSPRFSLGIGTEPPGGVDGDDTDGDLSIDFGFSESDLCYRIAGNKLDNPSFELQGTNPSAPNGGVLSLVHGFTSGVTSFGTDFNAYQWVGGINGTSLLNQPINRAVVNVTTSGSKLSWVESNKSRHGKRYLLMQGSNARLDLRAVSSGVWSSVLLPGSEYEFAVFADVASSASASLLLDLQASAPIFQILTGSTPGFFSNYQIDQSEFTGSPSTFAASDYNGWTEATANTSRPNWRKFTVRFRIAASATTSQIDAANLTLSTAASSGPIAMDYAYLCNMTPSNTLALCGTVWNDKSNNGTFESGEVGIGGVQVWLKGVGADSTPYTSDDPVLAGPLTTSTTGDYSFNGLAAGNYYVVANAPTGFPQSSGSPVNADNRVNNDNNGSQPNGRGTQVQSPLISLALGQEPITDGDGNPDTDCTVDFGFWSGFSVGNLVWFDADDNGTRGTIASEPGIQGLAVELVSPGADNTIGGSDDSVVATTSTDADGAYGFEVYEPGQYFIRVTPNATYQIPSSIAATADNGLDNDNNGVQPLLAGTFVYSNLFTLAAGSEPGSTGAANADNTIDIGLRTCPTITVAPASLAAAVQYAPYSQTVTASGGVGPYVCTVSGGSLPAGLTLDSSTGILSGTPTAAAIPGSYNFVVQARDAKGCSGTRPYSLTVQCPTVALAPATLGPAKQYSAYTDTVSASGGTAPYVFAITSGTLPVGITFNTSTGVLSGTPGANTTPGPYPLTISVTDALGCVGSLGYTLSVQCPTLAMAPASAPGATQDTAYSLTLTASGGSAPYTWSSTGGLPAGLSAGHSDIHHRHSERHAHRH